MIGSDGDTTARRSSRRRVLAAGAACLGLLAGCLGGDGDGDADAGGTGTGAGESTEPPDAGSDWRSIELTDVRTDDSFTIAGLDAPVVVQSFAVWCPKCQQQSNELSYFDGDATVVGLNTDPNEDAETVRQHAAENGFDWRFAVAPPAMTESLVDAFGPTVTNAPSTPVIVACGDGSATFLSGEVQAAAEIRTVADGC